jgi:poly-gamma-glutamate synthesis protein (capsule biosynthesis protein)
MKNFVRLTFIGDIMCQKEQSLAALARHGTYRYDEAFAPIRHLFVKSDYVIGNLETPLASEKHGYSTESFRFNTPESFLDALKLAGVNFVSTANNHILDRGVEGIVETLHCLDHHGMDHSGSYLNSDDSEKIFIKDFGDIKLALLSFTYGTNSEFYGDPLSEAEQWRVDLLRKQPAKKTSRTGSPTLKSRLQRWLPLRVKIALSALIGKTQRRVPQFIADNAPPDEIDSQANLRFIERARAKIIRAKEIADVVIILPHIGGQYNPAPGEYSKWTMQWIAGLGVDVIVANHPHVPLRCELFPNGALGAYSLGNFCFNPSDGCIIPGQFADYGIVLHLEISKDTRKISSASFQIVKTIVESDGFAVVHSLADLIRRETNPLERQMLVIENEVLVNRFCGGSATVMPQDEYRLSLTK